MPPDLRIRSVELRGFEPLTPSMPWAGVVLLAHAVRRSFPCFQGVIAHLVAIGWTCFKTVVTCGSLPNLSHRVGRSGGLPTPRLPLLAMARARVWAGCLAGPAVRSGKICGSVRRVIHGARLTRKSQSSLEHAFP